MLKSVLNERKDLQQYIFIRGFLITTNNFKDNQNSYPFYSNWDTTQIGNFQFYIHKLNKLFTVEKNGKSFFLIGHAYNPFTMQYDEKEILSSLADKLQKGKESYFEATDELTGLFILGYIEGNNISFMLDCSGMQYGCYGKIDEKIYISSHMQLIGDLCRLEMDEYVKELINYKWYKYMMGNYLPGELTAFKQVKRIVPNTNVDFEKNEFKVTRFYPNKEIKMCTNEEEYNEVIKQASEIMHNNMVLITKKWKKPAISLTGGLDSNTTFSAANGLYDKFSTFSYISMHRESVDAEVAGKISKKFDVTHRIIDVPKNNGEIDDFSTYKQILIHNDGEIGTYADNDIRKKITLMKVEFCDVEVKSWIAETFRAYAYKYFGRTSMPKDLKPRHYTSLYKIFFLNRSLVKRTDYHYQQYLTNTQLKEHLFNYDESDFFVWEMMHGAKCGLDIGVMKFCFDITIPYNNRKLLDILLRVKLEDRISDRHHLDMKKFLNKELYDMNSRVINLNETNFRKMLVNIYFILNSKFPF